MTTLYSNREPYEVCDHLSPAFLVEKWSHPITSDPAFLTEWGALENARVLSFDLGTYTGIRVEPGAQVCRPHRLPADRQEGVRFLDDVEVFVGLDDDINMLCATVPSRALSGVRFEGDPLDIIDELHFYASRTVAVPPTLFEATPAIRTHRLTDSWHQPIPNEMMPDQAEQEADPDVIPEPTQAPPIVHELFRVAEQQAAFSDLDSDGVMYIRTWYVHHVNLQRSSTSKILEFHEDWRRWVPDLLSSWREHYQPLEAVDFTVVTPDPYRGYLTQIVHADLIVSQGNWARRQPGLVTTHYQGRFAPPHTFAMAASFENSISGVHIATAGDALDWCLSPQHRCSITFGWTHIPFNHDLLHRMQAGHGFALVVHNALTSASSSTDMEQHGAIYAAASDQHVAPGGQSPEASPEEPNDPGENERDFDPPQDPPSDGPDREDSDVSIHSADLGVLVYRLNAPDAHCFATWTTYASILADIVHSLRLPRDQVRCFHRIAATPVGLRLPSEEAVILQCTDDVAPGSDEQLILVDLVVHYHPLASGLVVPPAARRQVLKVNAHLHRDQVLHLLRLHPYCRSQGDRCLIHKNHVLWAAADRTVHRILHGDYVRVQVPPPQSSTLDTDQAIALSLEQTILEELPCSEAAGPSHLALMQQAAILFQTYQVPDFAQCKTDPTEPDAVHFPPERLERAGATPWRQFNYANFVPGHLQQLARLVDSADLTEVEEEGKIAYITTWYLHHLTRKVCRESRPVRLVDRPDTWRDLIAEVWQDVIQPLELVRLRLVSPQPPCGIFECNQAHVLVEQGQRDDHISFLITSVDLASSDQRRPTVTHSAHSDEPLQTALSIIHKANPQHTGPLGRCQVFWRDRQFAWLEPDILDEGTNVIVKITSDAPPEESDGHALMQRTSMTSQRSSAASSSSGATTRAFCFNPRAAEFHPQGANIHLYDEFMQDLYDVWAHASFSWENEESTMNVAVWFVDHNWHQPHGFHCRTVRLWADHTTWVKTIESAWTDHRVPGASLEHHVVAPNPQSDDRQIGAHIISIQNPNEAWVTSLMTVYEEFDLHTPWKQVAVTTHEHILLENIFRAIDIFHVCLGRTPTFICTAWYQQVLLRPGVPLMGRSGYGITGRLHRIANAAQDENANDQDALLQISATPGARLTRGAVAQAHGPPGDSIQTSAVTLIHGTADDVPLPNIVEVLNPNPTSIQSELQCWGVEAQVTFFEQCDVAVCFTRGARLPDAHVGVVFSVAANGIVGPYHFERTTKPDEVELMKFLHRQGHPKAVILDVRDLAEGQQAIFFQEPTTTVSDVNFKVKPPPSWPPPQPRGSHDPFFIAGDHTDAQPECFLKLGATQEDLARLFDSARDTLHTNFENLNLDDDLYALLSNLPLLGDDMPDRYIIYVDGTSQGQQCHRSTAWVEECGVSDAWAMLVLAEIYATERAAPQLFLVGWTAQQVRYSPESQYHLGATIVGSLTAEREGLTWALLWRLGLNSRTPTLFRSDSLLTILQAQGAIGTSSVDDSFQCLRGAYQALDLALPEEHLRIQHVFGHNQEPFNDFTDIAAKLEAHSSFFIRRPDIDMTTWRTRLPFLWMIFGEQIGGPGLCSDGFDVAAPRLPPLSVPESLTPSIPGAETNVAVTMQLSFCTANVLSMYTLPDGFAGKLGYLVEQFQAHALLIGGLQEARTPKGMSTCQQILRLSSGANKGQGGVELWINLQQPYCYVDEQPAFLKASFFQVLCAEPRYLLVRVRAPHWNALLLVAHAPHSGRPQQECKEWWARLTDLIQQQQGELPLFVMVDANAEPGASDGTCVLGSHHKTSKSTPIWREFLHTFHLALPQTSDQHTGGQDTWVSPDGFTSHCLDYVAIPHGLLQCCTHSQLLEHFDLGNEQRDHTPIAVELQWSHFDRAGHDRKVKKTCFDRSSIRKSDLTGFLQHFQGAAWQTDVETQIHQFNDAVLTDLAKMCPPTRRGPKKSFITDDIWTLRKSKLHQRQKLHHGRKRQSLEALWLCFKAWRQHDASFSPVAAFNYGTTLHCGILRAFVAFRHYAKRLKTALRLAKYKGIVERIDELGAGAPASTILQTLRPFIGSSNAKARGRHPLPHLTTEDGQICPDPQVALDRWISFFNTMEGGERMSATTQRSLWWHNLQDLRADGFSLDVDQLPTLTDLEAAYRQVKSGKATGPDEIPSEICNTQPARMAKFTYPLLLKILLHGQEPLEHKGGRLIPLWKGKLNQGLCEAYRSILISSHVGKCLHRAIRMKQASVYEAYLQHQQIGGQRKAPVVLGVHAARAFLRHHHVGKRPCALLFLDLSEAFYRVLRPLALEGICQDKVLAAIAQRLNLGPHILADLHKHLQEPCATARAGLPPHLSRALRALHLDTHWHIRDQTDICRTTIGTRPVDAFADVVFGYLWSRVLDSFIQAVKVDEVFDTFPADQGPCLYNSEVEKGMLPKPFIGPCWMDDLCIALSADCGSTLIKKVHKVTGELLDQCLAHAMTPNLSAGKTELLFSLRGNGARQLRVQLYGPSAPRQLSIVGEYHTHFVRLVQQYTHLGGVLHHSGDLRSEIRRRLGVAHAAFTQHRKLLFANKQFSLKRRVELFQSLVLSKLTYGTESWTFPDIKIKEYLHSAVIRLYRRLLCVAGDQHHTDDQILAATGLPSPSELFRIQRLRYLGTLYGCRHLVDWGLLNADHAWVTLVEDDLRWLGFQLLDATHLRPPEQHVQEWLDIAHHHPRYWKRLIRRGVQHSVKQRHREQQLIQFHQGICRFMRAQGLLPPQGPADPPDADRCSDQAFGCMFCGCSQRTKGGEGAHQNRVHGWVNPVRHLYESTQCHSCMKEYHTATKLKAHLLHSTNCRQVLFGSGVRYQPMPGSGSTREGDIEKLHDRLLPPLQVFGPQQQYLALRDFDGIDWNLHDDCCLLFLDAATVEDAILGVRHRVQQHPISWTMCRRTLLQLAATIAEHAHEDALQHLNSQLLGAKLLHLSTPDSWSFLSGHKIASEDPVGLGQLETELLGCLTPPEWPAPRAFGRHRVILHAFSGRRRLGDFQYYLDAFLAEHSDGLVIHTVSLDVVVDAERGDISRIEVRNFWLHGIDQGWILAFLAGPPCETWSRARAVKCASDARQGPRVIRTADDLWGLAHLRLRELEQIDVGNLLLCFSAEAFLRLASTGGFAVIEHPREPEEPHFASIWKLPIFQMLRLLPGVELHSLSQGFLGAPSCKPTSLLCLNLPHICQAIVKNQITATRPQGAAIGKTASGHWATSALKEYPPALNRALAGQFFQAITSLPCDASILIDNSFLQVCRDLTVTKFTNVLGQDYAG